MKNFFKFKSFSSISLDNEEINITQHFMYKSVDDEKLYAALFKNDNDKNTISMKEHKQFEMLFEAFQNLSLEGKYKKIKSIKVFSDGCTTWEPELVYLYNRRNMVYNFIMLSYLEILLKEKKEVDIICWVDENLFKVREKFDDVEYQMIEKHKKNYFNF